MRRCSKLVLVFAFALPATAAAEPGFPREIAAHLGLETDPPAKCLLCHASAVGGDAVVQRFGLAMIDAGLTANGIANGSLDAALDKLATEGTDSNGNGVTDIDELRAGNDPNANAHSRPPLEYGCGVGQIAARARVNHPTSLLAVFAFFGFVTRAMHRHRHAIRKRKLGQAAQSRSSAQGQRQCYHCHGTHPRRLPSPTERTLTIAHPAESRASKCPWH